MKKIVIGILVTCSLFFLSFPCIVSAKSSSFSDSLLIFGELDIQPINPGEVSCNSLFMKDGAYNSLYYVLQDAFTLIKFAAPILVIVLSSMDYIKAITSHDAEGLKKANTKFIKRLVIGVLIFLLPFLLDLVFEAFGLYDLSTCGIGK